MDTLLIVASFWVAGIGMAIYTLYLPAIKIIGLIDKNNLGYRYAWMGGIVFAFFSAVCLPFLVHIILIEVNQDRFFRASIPAYMGEK